MADDPLKHHVRVESEDVIHRKPMGMPFNVNPTVSIGHMFQLFGMLAMAAAFFWGRLDLAANGVADTDKKVLVVATDVSLAKLRLDVAEKNIDLLRTDQKENMTEIRNALKEINSSVGDLRTAVVHK